MRRSVRNAFVIGILLGAGTNASGGDPGMGMVVRIYNYAGVPLSIVEQAKDFAVQPFGSAGIDLEWIVCAIGTEAVSSPACEAPFSPMVPGLRVRAVAPLELGVRKGVSGIALLGDDEGFGQLADVFFDQVERQAADLWQGGFRRYRGGMTPSRCRALALGLVMAHELGHLLLGSNSHTRSGIMRPNMGRLEFENFYVGRLYFRKRQLETLQANLKARAEAAVTPLDSARRDGKQDPPALGTESGRSITASRGPH